VDETGDPQYAAPVEIDCRWDDEQVEFLTPNGEKQISNARVMVDREVVLGGLLRRGTLDSVLHYTRPFDNSGTYEIRLLRNIDNIRATETLRIAMV
jgi:hypothetical protein